MSMVTAMLLRRAASSSAFAVVLRVHKQHARGHCRLAVRMCTARRRGRRRRSINEDRRTAYGVEATAVRTIIEETAFSVFHSWVKKTKNEWTQKYTDRVWDIAYRIIPGKWTEKTGLNLQGFPGQPYGNDSGIFMLMVRVMTDQWCIENSGDLLGSVQLPRILCMEDEEAAEALEQFFCAEFIKDDLVEPLIFVFKFTQDMHTFLENVVDKMHLRIFCRTQN